MKSFVKRPSCSCVSFRLLILANVGILSKIYALAFWVGLWLVAALSEGLDIHVLGVEDGNSRFLRNIGDQPQVCMVSYIRWPQYKPSLT
jgi:hypothetical protein